MDWDYVRQSLGVARSLGPQAGSATAITYLCTKQEVISELSVKSLNSDYGYER
jgi:hypothetical protein